MIKTIFWDFDGVILDSMPIRDYGFAKIFEDFDNIIQTLNNDEKIVLETFFQNDSNMDKNKFKNILLDIKKMQKVTSEKAIQSLISKNILNETTFNVILTSFGLEIVDKLFRRTYENKI